MDKELISHVREARKFVLETMKKVRDSDLEIPRANAVNKGAGELVKLGKLELDCEKLSKVESIK